MEPAPPAKRRCASCGCWKPEEEFADKSRPSGFRGQCGFCTETSKLVSTAKGPVAKMLNAARHRARLKDIPFTLTVADISIPERCPVLHQKLEPGHRDNAPSLDRIIPALGYVPGNIIVISSRANRIKNDATPDELHDIAEFFTAVARGKAPPRRTK